MKINRTLVWVAVYAVAMGFVEAAVVVYLRRLYFPGGFHFPLQMVENDIAIVELWREIATITMLAAIGAIAGRTKAERFAYFVFAFGIWDLVYYAGLKAAIGWPESWLTWDILFLLPVPWVGPVIAPCLIALTMILFGVIVVRKTTAGYSAEMTPRERHALWIGALVAIVSFTLDWTRTDGPILWANITGHRFLVYGLGTYVPHSFPWWIFVIGEGLMIAAVATFASRHPVSVVTSS